MELFENDWGASTKVGMWVTTSNEWLHDDTC